MAPTQLNRLTEPEPGVTVTAAGGKMSFIRNERGWSLVTRDEKSPMYVTWDYLTERFGPVRILGLSPAELARRAEEDWIASMLRHTEEWRTDWEAWTELHQENPVNVLLLAIWNNHKETL